MKRACAFVRVRVRACERGGYTGVFFLGLACKQTPPCRKLDAKIVVSYIATCLNLLNEDIWHQARKVDGVDSGGLGGIEEPGRIWPERGENVARNEG